MLSVCTFKYLGDVPLIEQADQCLSTVDVIYSHREHFPYCTLPLISIENINLEIALKSLP